MAAPPLEQELKYRVEDAATGVRLAAARTIGRFRAAGRPRQVEVEDRYLDTADGALGRAGYAVRLRRGPSTTVVAVKSTTSTASALHRREELEGPANPSFDPHDWPPSAARALVLEHAGDAPLVELVTVRQLRRVRILADESAEVELSLDDVAVVAGGRVVETFVELEAELRRGPESSLDGLASALGSEPGLAPVTSSKLERALAAVGAARRPAPEATNLADDAQGAAAPAAPEAAPAPEPAAAPEPPPAAPVATAAAVAAAGPADEAGRAARRAAVAVPRLVVGKTPGVTGEDVLAEAGRKVLRFHFARMLAREAGTRSGEDIEELHAMRVATRRMRAAWRVFGDGFRADRTRVLRRRLRVLAGRLGAVRDLDVLLEAAELYQGTLPPRQATGLEPLLAAWRDERAAARIVLLRELDGNAFVRLVEEYRAFVATEGAAVLAPASPIAPHHVRDTAASRIWLAYEQVRGYEPVLRWADIETIHQLRIAGKWLRYTLEFFREALGPEIDVLIARVTALQDHLGLLHDADVRIHLTRRFLVANAGSLSREETHAIATYLAREEKELARLRRTMGTPWRAVAGPSFRRLLGRAVAAL